MLHRPITKADYIWGKKKKKESVKNIAQMVSISRLIRNNFQSHGAENICK